MSSKPSDGAKSFLEAVAEKNGKPVQALSDKPKYDFTVQWYLDAFSSLSMSRQMGMGLGYIPFSEIAKYAEIIGHIEDDVQDFIQIVQAMDSAYLSEVNKNSNK